MNIERATEIIESLGVIEVSYKGDPVWLENINKQSNTVRVKNMKTDEELNVGIRDLEEV
ncbi:H-type small acid-soluble spore protein [Clostridium magnum]|uniref:Small, acid-soluble spore protein H n=1 Tax=Clostridium magnum DSM 2767 TaxID=1121326 RepID=A0A162UDP6_9CLOT|nr:H-type small acid-soluble spore protein [Clostridium magnum]KZL93793.1 small, acid-soluble spore protein H [Clostridium magnum DSM 2767]SHI08794.1 small acid-soluble spore protein H (minor) [Clostridium magnum DSM 2767]